MMNTPRRLHVGILIGRFPPGPQGGAEHQAEGWARQLSDLHRVTVITRAEPAVPAGTEAREGFRVIRLPLSRVPLWRSWRDLRAIEATVLTMNPRPDVLLCFQTLISGLAGTRLQRRAGIPAGVWIRGEGEYRMRDSFTARLMAPRAWAAASGVLVQSEGHARALLDELARFAPAIRNTVASRLEVIPNGLDLPHPLPEAAPGGPILSVGRLIRDKGMDTLIEALAGSPRLLIIVGDGPERASLERLARARSTPAEFAGPLSRERLAVRYGESSCVVLASRRGEGLPNVVLEAMAHGRPIVATRVSGNSELIENEHTGLLVPADEPAALRAAIDRVLADPALAARLGASARTAAEPFAWERVRPRLEGALARWVG